MTKNTNITIYDVAGMARVSMATVSRVINYPNKVNAKTRERVLKVIDELGFKPNPIARDLAARKSMTVIYIIVSSLLFQSIPQILTGILDAADELNYSVKICSIHKKKKIKDFLNKLILEKINGVVFLNDKSDKYKQDLMSEIFENNNIPFKILDIADTSDSSAYQKGYTAIESLKSVIK